MNYDRIIGLGLAQPGFVIVVSYALNVLTFALLAWLTARVAGVEMVDVQRKEDE